METVRQRNIARDWWWSQTEAYKQHLLDKHVKDTEKHSLVVPRLYDNNIVFRIYESETGNKISEL
jgi:hypothetical protein